MAGAAPGPRGKVPGVKVVRGQTPEERRREYDTARSRHGIFVGLTLLLFQVHVGIIVAARALLGALVGEDIPLALPGWLGTTLAVAILAASLAGAVPLTRAILRRTQGAARKEEE